MASTALRNRPGRPPAAAGDRRQHIVAVAARLFAEYGFGQTTVRQIADEVGMLSGSLYHHFATKEDILHEALREPLRRIVEQNRSIAGLAVDPELRLVALILLRFRDFLANWDIHAILMQESNLFWRSADFAYVPEMKRASFHVLEDVLRQGMDSGRFQPGMDTYLMIGTISRLLSAAAGWFRSGKPGNATRANEYAIEEITEFHLDCVLRMVRAPDRIAAPIPLTEGDALLMALAGPA